MYVAKICLNSLPGGPTNFILGADIMTTPPPIKWLPWQHWLPGNGATKSAFYDRIYQKHKGL